VVRCSNGKESFAFELAAYLSVDVAAKPDCRAT
jgi:hypothetical protein